jgi:hypothetical protein
MITGAVAGCLPFEDVLYDVALTEDSRSAFGGRFALRCQNRPERG